MQTAAVRVCQRIALPSHGGDRPQRILQGGRHLELFGPALGTMGDWQTMGVLHARRVRAWLDRQRATRLLVKRVYTRDPRWWGFVRDADKRCALAPICSARVH